LGALCEYLEDMPTGLRHHIKDTDDKFIWYLLVKEVAHAIDKYSSTLPPSQGESNLILVERHFEPILVSRITHGVEAAREALSVAVLASRTDFGAASNRIPSRVGPF